MSVSQTITNRNRIAAKPMAASRRNSTGAISSSRRIEQASGAPGRAGRATPASRRQASPSAISAIAVPGQPNPSSKAEPISAAAADAKHRDCGRGAQTSVSHSHSTTSAASAQNADKDHAAEIGRGQRERREHQRRHDAQDEIAAARSGGSAGTAVVGRARRLPRSGSGLRDQAAKAPFAAAVFGDRVLQRRAVEIGPIGRHEHQFAIGRLPQKKIRQPLLAAGADDEVGIGQVGRVEVLRR